MTGPPEPDPDAYAGRRVCVTGGAGFIGSHLVDALVEAGAVVSVIDDLSHGRAENLADAAARIRLVRGSILDDRALREAIDGCEIIFHQAALTSVPRSVHEPALFHEVNNTGTLRVLEAARASGVTRIIYAASSSAYGDQVEAGERAAPKVESMCPRPLSPYAASKYAGEHLMRAWAHCYDLATISLRYFNIFGPRQRADSPYAAVIPIFADAMLAGRKPVIYGDGTQTRDFTYVANAVRANMLAGAAPAESLRGDVVNIACGMSTPLRTLLERIAQHLDVTPTCDFAPPRVGEVKHSRANIDLARALVGYEPAVSFEDGLARTLDWFIAQHDPRDSGR